jgi:hypothetical protein
MWVIYFWIALLVGLIGIQCYVYVFKTPIVEGLDTMEESDKPSYKPYDMNNPNNALMLAQQNAGNIEVLKGRIEHLDGIQGQVDNIQRSIDSMQVQIESLVQQQADYAQELAGNTPVEVTGTEEETLEEVEASLSENK